jgi:hypothetical protein
MKRQPVLRIVLLWHWKSAAMSAFFRGLLFFATNIASGPGAAARAMLVETLIRIPMVGVLAAVAQAFARVEPPWAGAVAATAVLPAVAHAAEYAVHAAAGTPALAASIVGSLAMSIVATLFSLYAARRGVMVVGDAAQPLGDDLRKLPALIVEFATAPARAIARASVRRIDRASPPR